MNRFQLLARRGCLKTVTQSLAIAFSVSLLCSCVRAEEPTSIKSAAPFSAAAIAASAPVRIKGLIGLPGLNKPNEWLYDNEEQWVVDSISRDIAEMLLFGAQNEKMSPFKGLDIQVRTAGPDSSYRVDLTTPALLKGAQYKLKLNDFLWAPSNYEPLAAAVLGDLKLTPQAGSEASADFIGRLCNADMPALFAEAERVSQELEMRPLDASLHEQAALIQIIMALQENAAGYSDPRPVLNRTCAHLSIARALNMGRAGLAGQLADLGLDSISCREASAIAKNDQLSKVDQPAAVKSFLRAMRIKGTGDWRFFKPAEKTRVEESEYLLRFASFRRNDAAAEYVLKNYPDLPVFWARIISNTSSSVSNANLLGEKVIPLELEDFVRDYNAVHKTAEKDPLKLLGDLNLVSSRCINLNAKDGAAHMQILSWDDLAAYHCRHLLSAVASEYRCNHNIFGSKSASEETIARTKKDFSEISMIPLAMMDFELDPKDLDQFFARGNSLLVNQPYLVTGGKWYDYQTTARVKPNSGAIPNEMWFERAIPKGTPFYYYNRHDLASYKNDLPELESLLKLNPYDQSLCIDYALKKFGANPTTAQYREAFGPIADYNLYAIRFIAAADIKNPDLFIPAQEKLAEFEPSAYFTLGEYCVLHGRPQDAARFFEKAVALEEDAVGIANSSDWLVNYRYDHGDKAGALKLAKFAADVYSAAGLQTLARYYEKTGNYSGAEELYRAMQERYDSDSDLVAFMLRNPGKKPEYAAEAAALKKKIFPNGMEMIDRAKLKGAPTFGMKLTRGNVLRTDAPILRGNVIVAANGIAVRTRAQFDLVRDSSKGGSVRVLIWNGKDYIESVQHFVNGTKLGISYEPIPQTK